MTIKTKSLIEFLRGRLSWRDLPEEISLPANLWRQMDELWQRSIAHIADGQVSEWGGTLILDREDHLKLINIVQGTMGYVALNHSTEDTFVGTFHTHSALNGMTGIAFSGVDIADAINSGEMLSLIQSGRNVYALLRTDRTPLHVDRRLCVTDFEEQALGYLGQGMSLSRAIRYTNIDLCQQFDLCFYEGIVFDDLVEEYRP
ncbi:MAG: hypothetical protein ACE5LU_16695 [Anaerolineae bacterium]